MQRDEIKALFGGMPTGTNITIKFYPPFGSLNGEYSFIEAKTGRGRGGSLVVSVKNTTNNKVLTDLEVDGAKKAFGTAVAEFIQSITAGEKVVGVVEATKADLPQKPKSPKAKENSLRLKDVLVTLGYIRGDNVQVEIASDDKDIAGVWTAGKNAIKHPGRFGQVSLGFTRVVDGVTQKMELWSYKDVDRVNAIDLLTSKE